VGEMGKIMKISDILNEHQTVKRPTGVTWITSEAEEGFLKNGKKLPMPLKMAYGDFDIYQWELYFAAIRNNELYAIMGLREFKDDIFQMSQFERAHSPAKNTKDLAAALFHYIVLDLNYTVISDNTMTPEANDFWKSQIIRRQCPIYIWDSTTGEKYDSWEAGKTIGEPPIKVISPENDLGKIDLKTSSTNYRWYWIAEIPKKARSTHYLKEEIARGKEPSWVLFGYQDYPNDLYYLLSAKLNMNTTDKGKLL